MLEFSIYLNCHGFLSIRSGPYPRVHKCMRLLFHADAQIAEYDYSEDDQTVSLHSATCAV